MSKDQNPATWTGPLIRFIKDSLPVLDPKGEEWDHMFATAYQFGCEALAALGQAEETGRGARPLARSRLPEVLPRWDDICVTVLSLASQRGQLSYRLSCFLRAYHAAGRPVLARQACRPLHKRYTTALFSMPEVITLCKMLLWRIRPFHGIRSGLCRVL